jgi:hypothetical protein
MRLHLILLSLAALLSTSASAQFTENVTFRFRSDQITYQGPITSAFLMMDVDGGRNPVGGARRMTCNNNQPKECSLTVRCPRATSSTSSWPTPISS